MAGPAAAAAAPQPGFQLNPAASGLGDTSQLVAPVTGAEQTLLGTLVSSGLQTNPLIEAAKGQLSATLAGGQTNPFLNEAIEAAQRPLIDAFTNVTVPQLLSRFTGGGQEVQGQGSSAFANAATTSARDFGNQLKDVSSQLSFQSFNEERARQLAAVDQAVGLRRGETENLVSILQQAALPRLVQDLGIQRGIEEFNRRIQTLLASLQLGVQAAQPVTGTKSKTNGGFNFGISGGGGSSEGGG